AKIIVETIETGSSCSNRRGSSWRNGCCCLRAHIADPENCIPKLYRITVTQLGIGYLIAVDSRHRSTTKMHKRIRAITIALKDSKNTCDNWIVETKMRTGELANFDRIQVKLLRSLELPIADVFKLHCHVALTHHHVPFQPMFSTDSKIPTPRTETLEPNQPD